MPKRKPIEPQRIEVYGNNGGDYIKLVEEPEEDLYNSRVYLEVGHCCVKSIKAKVPVELLTLILAGLANHYDSLKELMENLDKHGIRAWDDYYMTASIAKIEEE